MTILQLYAFQWLCKRVVPHYCLIALCMGNVAVIRLSIVCSHMLQPLLQYRCHTDWLYIEECLSAPLYRALKERAILYTWTSFFWCGLIFMGQWYYSLVRRLMKVYNVYYATCDLKARKKHRTMFQRLVIAYRYW